MDEKSAHSEAEATRPGLEEDKVKSLRSNRWGSGLVAAAICCLGAACATTGGGGSQPAPIPEGMGRLYLDAGGIKQLNFFVIDQETDEEVYSDTPRLLGSSPIAYQSGVEEYRLKVDLPPGTYTVIVNTDIEDNVEVRDIKVVMGEDMYVGIPVGRFQLRFLGQGGPQQVPFVVMDYNMRGVLGKLMTSTELRHFILPAGRPYKIRVENSPTGVNENRSLEVRVGSITQLTIESAPTTTEVPGGTTQ